jgi:hypothetical protein
LSTAATYAQRAGNSAEAQNVRGILALKQGKLAQARELLKQAAGSGNLDAQANLETVEAILTAQSQQVLDD